MGKQGNVRKAIHNYHQPMVLYSYIPTKELMIVTEIKLYLKKAKTQWLIRECRFLFLN